MDVQKWCKNCSEISYFRQIIPNTLSFDDYYTTKYCIHYFIKQGCELCNERTSLLSEHIPDRYQTSSGWVKSTLNERHIAILYLPWWDNYGTCIICSRELKYINPELETYSQKWCPYCFIIYTGCRYCLTTNIIFGITGQSQCKKCKRVSFINIDTTNTASGNYIIDEFLASTRINNNSQCLIAKYTVNTKLNPLSVYKFIRNFYVRKQIIEWIPFSQFKNVNITKHFLNELKSLYHCYDADDSIIRCYGVSQNPLTKDYLLIMDYAKGGNLSDYLQKYFVKITWAEKIKILTDFSYGLQIIHKNNFIHRDIHSGNILLSNLWKNEMLKQIHCWQIGDLGLSQPASNTLSNNEIYGVIPYVAPEIFKGAAFSKESDIYSLGMVMWEITTGCKPFANVKHDINLIYQIIDGKRPEITNDTPECFANLMKKCWNSDPLKRPTIYEVRNSAVKWCQLTYDWVYSGIPFIKHVDSADLIEAMEQAEKERLELIRSEKLGPKSIEKSHPNAIFTSRALSSFISRPLAINSTTTISFNLKKEYITIEYEFDIDNIQSSAQNVCNSHRQNAIISRPLSKLISIGTENSSRKRNIAELKIGTRNNRKHFKTDN
ncbi:kinase-like domain-containing protein [Rhizophagus clarus]|uniref:Kinase-like domain-containing protein n=1 Tax=Rhizophagus clarus TaxID=94130 RepID=A0A8H3L6H6_9GLOM|nr:kinase-like domain-containing protein [Rhizophagus clarus]